MASGYLKASTGSLLNYEIPPKKSLRQHDRAAKSLEKYQQVHKAIKLWYAPENSQPQASLPAFLVDPAEQLRRLYTFFQDLI